MSVLSDLAEALGPDRKCVVARELTKVHDLWLTILLLERSIVRLQCSGYGHGEEALQWLSSNIDNGYELCDKVAFCFQVYEEFYRGTLEDALAEFGSRNARVRPRLCVQI